MQIHKLLIREYEILSVIPKPLALRLYVLQHALSLRLYYPNTIPAIMPAVFVNVHPVYSTLLGAFMYAKVKSTSPTP